MKNEGDRILEAAITHVWSGPRNNLHEGLDEMSDWNHRTRNVQVNHVYHHLLDRTRERVKSNVIDVVLSDLGR